jgi:hypothetical protein
MGDVRVEAAEQADALAIRELAADAWHAASDDFLGPDAWPTSSTTGPPSAGSGRP